MFIFLCVLSSLPRQLKTWRARQKLTQAQAAARLGDVEKDAKVEVSALLAGFKARTKAEEKRKWAAIDSEYWFCVCFQTREQKEAFLTAMKWLDHGDKYLDGQWVAKKLGVKLPDGGLTFQGEKKLSSFTKVLKPIRKLKGGEGK